jgi:hypothetical protein
VTTATRYHCQPSAPALAGVLVTWNLNSNVPRSERRVSCAISCLYGENYSTRKPMNDLQANEQHGG